MHRSIVWGSLMAALMMAFAGCTGQFEVDQTEPFQVQIDGDPQTVTVREGSEAQRVTIETADVESVEVEVTVTKVSDGPCTIHVVVEGDDGSSLAEKDIQVGGNDTPDVDGNASSDGNETDGNVTVDDDTDDGDTTIVETLIVNVQGNNNIVVVSEAQQGDAEVNIAARGGTVNDNDGNQTVNNTDMGDDGDDGPY